MVSEVDLAVERAVRDFLATRTPDIRFLGEENDTSSKGDDFLWALDPVDGTANFVRGLPLCAISLGLARRDRAVLGVIDLPFLGSRYTAGEGHGAQKNGQPIHVSQTSQLGDAIVAIGDYATGTNAEAKNKVRLAITTQLAATVQRVRMLGSAAVDLAWLAEGRLDATIMLSNKPWDTTAGVAIAREAGAHVIDTDGTDHTLTATATIAITPALVDAVTQVGGPVHNRYTGRLVCGDMDEAGPDVPFVFDADRRYVRLGTKEWGPKLDLRFDGDLLPQVEYAFVLLSEISRFGTRQRVAATGGLTTYGTAAGAHFVSHHLPSYARTQRMGRSPNVAILVRASMVNGQPYDLRALHWIRIDETGTRPD